MSGGRKVLAGFLLSGFLMASLGAVLPVWGYHRDPPRFVAVGNYFLSLAAGTVASPSLARRLLVGWSLSRTLVFACSLSSAALACLALLSPPLSSWWRVAGLAVLGSGVGILNFTLFHAIVPGSYPDPASTVSLGGLWYGFGCLSATLLAAATLNAYAPIGVLLLMALVPAAFAILYAATPLSGNSNANSARHSGKDFRSLTAVLFTLLLFFQFGNEWSVAGWLALFLIRRVGLSPIAGLLTLALYWLLLLAGRLLSIHILRYVHHGLLLGVGALAALFGSFLLYFTNNSFGAAAGVVFIAGGYATIYPLLAQLIGRRLPQYNAGFGSSILLLAIAGGLLAPAAVGYAASILGVGVVIGLPFLGTCMVLTLLMLLWVESRLAQ